MVEMLFLWTLVLFRMLSNVVVTFVTKRDTCDMIVHLRKCSSNGGSNRLVWKSLSSLDQKTDAKVQVKLYLYSVTP